MSGAPINSEQVKLYMKTRTEGKTQVTAAAKAGISERSGRRAEKGELQPGGKKKRYWRTEVRNRFLLYHAVWKIKRHLLPEYSIR